MSQDVHDDKVNALIKQSLTNILDDALATLDKHHLMQRQRLIDEYRKCIRSINLNGTLKLTDD